MTTLLDAAGNSTNRTAGNGSGAFGSIRPRSLSPFLDLERLEVKRGAGMSLGNPPSRVSGHRLPTSWNAPGIVSPRRKLCRPWVWPECWYLGWRRVLLRLGVVAPVNRLRPAALEKRRERAAALFAAGRVLR